MEVRDEIKKKGIGGSFTPYSRYKASERDSYFCVINEFAFYGSKFIYSDVNKGLVDNFSLSSISTGQIVGLVAFFIMQTIGRIVYIFIKLYRTEDCSWTERTFVEKVLILPVSYYDQNRTGDTISRMTNDTGVVKTLISEHLSNLLTGGISIVGSLIVLFVLD